MATILSLDGGGSWALIQALALENLYPNMRGHQILSHFDLAAGTSGGSLVLAGLACNWSPREIAQKFLSRPDRMRIFAPSWTYWITPRWPPRLWPVYSARGKLRGLNELLETHNLRLDKVPELIGAESESQRTTHLLILGFDYDRKRTTFFRSNPASRASSSPPTFIPTLAEAVHASSNAPVTFFNRPARVKSAQDDASRELRYWDGAIGGYNNPVLAAVIEVLANRVPPGDVKVLSIGTGTDLRPPEDAGNGLKRPLAKPRQASWILPDLARMATTILDDPPDAATFIAHMMLGQPLPDHGDPPAGSSIVRLNPVIRPVRTGPRQWNWPPALTVQEWERLVKLSMDATADSDVALIEKFARAWMAGDVLNQPVRAGPDFRPQIGHDRFLAARDAWLALSPVPAGAPGG
jgi:uncharacterized protein